MVANWLSRPNRMEESFAPAAAAAAADCMCRDLVPMIHWNEAHGVRLFRLSSNIFPWMTSYRFEDLPNWPDIQKVGGWG
jgi:hypothetical protein